MLYLIGLGLGDEKDITLKGLEAVKRCDEVFLEAYTSLLSGISGDGISTLGNLYGKPVTLAYRKMVEENADEIILGRARHSDVAFLVVGEPFGATTHTSLVIRAKQMGVEVKKTWRPDSFYDKIQRNRSVGQHTLCLLDIKVKEQSDESQSRYMMINTAIEQLLEVEQKRGESAYSEHTDCVGFARLGSENQMVVAGPMKQLRTIDFGGPLHCLVIVGKTHPVEEEMLDFYRFKGGIIKQEDTETT